MIKSYYDFLLESILFTSQYFEDILKSINDDISNDLLSFINKDIKTQYNAINITDTNDRLSFVSDNQFQNKIKQGVNPLDLFKDDNNKTNITRIVRQILKDNGKEYTDSDLSKFVDKFKASYNSYKAKKERKEPFRLVSGEDIRYWYLLDNYCNKTLSGYGTLGKSCMRYEECQSYFDIYVNNPNVVQLLIKTDFEDGEEKLKARALFWKTDKGTFLDRIYYTDFEEHQEMINWCKENLKPTFHPGKYIGDVKVVLESNQNEYSKYPYMDSLPYYYTLERTLYSCEQPHVNQRSELLYLQDTDGGFQTQDSVYCEYIDDSLPEDEVVWSEYHSSYLPIHSSVWSDYYNSELFDDDAVYSNTLQDHLPREESVKVHIDSRNQDWFPQNHDLIAIDPYVDEWYLIKLMREVKGQYYYKGNLIEVFGIRKEDIPKYREIFNIDESVSDDNCVVSINIIKFYKFNVIDESTQFMLFEDYYELVYMNVHYTEMMKSLNEKENSDDMIEELYAADYRLKDRNNFYTNNNFIINNGGLENAIRIFNEYLDKKSTGNTMSIFDVAFSTAEEFNRYHVQSDLLKTQIRKIYKDNLFEFCKGVSRYGNKYMEIDKSKLSGIIKMFKTTFKEYNNDDEINYYLNMTGNTLEFSFMEIYSLRGENFRLMRSLRYFTENPNKLPIE